MIYHVNIDERVELFVEYFAYMRERDNVWNRVRDRVIGQVRDRMEFSVWDRVRARVEARAFEKINR